MNCLADGWSWAIRTFAAENGLTKLKKFPSNRQKLRAARTNMATCACSIDSVLWLKFSCIEMFVIFWEKNGQNCKPFNIVFDTFRQQVLWLVSWYTSKLEIRLRLCPEIWLIWIEIADQMCLCIYRKWKWKIYQ